MPLGDKAEAALPLRAATLKQQAMITRHSGKRQASLKPALIFKKKKTFDKFKLTNEVKRHVSFNQTIENMMSTKIKSRANVMPANNFDN